jgi:hypothetical protein
MRHASEKNENSSWRTENSNHSLHAQHSQHCFTEKASCRLVISLKTLPVVLLLMINSNAYYYFTLFVIYIVLLQDSFPLLYE